MHPQVAAVLGVLADVRADAGKLEAARALARRGLAIFDAAKLNNVGTVEALERLGKIERRIGHEDAAVADFGRARAIAVDLYGPDHAMVAELEQLMNRPRGRP